MSFNSHHVFESCCLPNVEFTRFRSKEQVIPIPYHTTRWEIRNKLISLKQLSWWLQHAYWNTSGDFLNRISHRDARSNILTTLSPPQVHSLLPSIEREKVSETNQRGSYSFPSPYLAMVNLGMRLCVCHSNWRVKLYCGSCECEDGPLTSKTARIWVRK